MKANELRIGNWVRLHGFNEQINVIDECGVIGTKKQPLADVKELQPIPLTEEILLKSDLKHNLDKTIFEIVNKVVGGIEFQITIRNYYGEFQLWKEDSLFIDKPITYLHQLQNWIYLLTQKELNIEL